MDTCVHSTTDVLGSGQFGVVFKGEWMASREGGKVDVAVKTLKDGSADEDKVKFLQEAAIIGQFSHPNVVKLHGIVIGEQVRLLFFHLLVTPLNSIEDLCSSYM